MRGFFRLVVLKCTFMFKSNSLCKFEKLVVFLWHIQALRGTGRAEIYIFLRFGELRVRRCTLRGVLLIRGIDGGCWLYWILRVSFFLAVYWLWSIGGWAYSWLISCSTNSIILLLVRKGEKELSSTTGMEYPNGMRSSFFSGKSWVYSICWL